jgi:phosphate transport system protein
VKRRRPSLGAGCAVGPGAPTFADELEALERRLLAMRRLVSEQITDAVRMLTPDGPHSGRVALREGTVDALGARIESQCFSMLARRPRTSRQQRRLLGTIIRIATALERIGDAGMLVAERSSELSGVALPPGPWVIVQRMAANALDMVAQAMAAFRARDGELASTVRASRPGVAGLGERLVHDALRAVGAGGESPVAPAMRFVAIADQLEQVAGHAVGIAERVVTLVADVPDAPRRLGRTREMLPRRGQNPALRLQPGAGRATER